MTLLNRQMTSRIMQNSRFAAKFPEHGPKQQGYGDGEAESGGVVGGSAPESDEELLDDDEVLLLEVAGVLGIKVQGRDFRVRGADLLYQSLLSPAWPQTNGQPDRHQTVRDSHRNTNTLSQKHSDSHYGEESRQKGCEQCMGDAARL